MKIKLDSMESLYVEQLTDLLSAEKQLVKALPKAMKAAGSVELRQAIEGHLAETQEHVARIEQIFTNLGKKPPSHKCAAMEGLVEETSEIIKADGEIEVKDAALIAGAQRIEHYEIAGYGCARTFARMLGRADDARILQKTLDEEKATDEKLTRIAEGSINQRAARA